MQQDVNRHKQGELIRIKHGLGDSIAQEGDEGERESKLDGGNIMKAMRKMDEGERI